LLEDCRRIGKEPSPDFVVSIAALGALAKKANPNFSAP
jgi:hypothetical protein